MLDSILALVIGMITGYFLICLIRAIINNNHKRYIIKMIKDDD